MEGRSKIKLLKILEIISKTDENHSLTIEEIRKKLAVYGIDAERKSISRDLKVLEDAGYQIILCKNHNDGCYMIEHTFQDFELKLITDAIASTKILTVEDSRDLINRIKEFATLEAEAFIDNTVVLDSKIKRKDRHLSIYFDVVMRAIVAGKKITFQYIDRMSAVKTFRNNGEVIQASPYYLVPMNGKYYVVCLADNATSVHNYRLDLMVNIQMTDLEIKPKWQVDELKEIGHTMTDGDYLRLSTHSWTGVKENVTLEGINWCRVNVVDKFGDDIMIRSIGEDKFIAHMNVAVNEGFYQWLASYGINLKLLSPENRVAEFKEYITRIYEQYEDGKKSGPKME